MKKTILLFLLVPMIISSQNNELPFYEIEGYPEQYSETNIVIRMIDGLGYRYYWATESLNEKDLNFKPSQSSRSTFEVMEHIYTLTLMISSSFEKKEFDFNQEKLEYKLLREKTLNKLDFIKHKLKETNSLSDLKIQFNREGNKMTFPFWNHLNGPIADALWHSGQIVSNRRASGNPLNSKVNVFIGKTSQ